MNGLDFKCHVFVGLDEAGRGPLVGDMVVASVAAKADALEKLINAGLADSKKLTPQERSTLLLEALRSGVVIIAHYIAPWRLDRENINDIEACVAREALSIISRLFREVDVGKICVLADEIKGRRLKVEESAKATFQSRLGAFVMEEKADAKFSPMSLASIAAKVYRDANLKVARVVFGNFGSGYPHDPKTQEWVQKLYATGAPKPAIVRFSWSCLKNLAPGWYIKKTMKKAGVHVYYYTLLLSHSTHLI